MRKVGFLILVFCLGSSLVLVGCGAKKAASSNEAIELSKTMQTVEQKANYLLGQAKTFYNSKDFQQAVNVAQYVLSYVDKNSTEAQSLLEKAKAQLTALAQQKAAELKSKFGVR